MCVPIAHMFCPSLSNLPQPSISDTGITMAIVGTKVLLRTKVIYTTYKTYIFANVADLLREWPHRSGPPGAAAGTSLLSSRMGFSNRGTELSTKGSGRTAAKHGKSRAQR